MFPKECWTSELCLQCQYLDAPGLHCCGLLVLELVEVLICRQGLQIIDSWPGQELQRKHLLIIAICICYMLFCLRLAYQR